MTVSIKLVNSWGDFARQAPWSHPECSAEAVDHSAPEILAPPAAEPPSPALALLDRLRGLELDLTNLSEEHEPLTLSDWHALQSAAQMGGGAGISYVECQAQVLPLITAGLLQLPNLDCISVLAPANGGELDLSQFDGGRPSRVNILGVASAPLHIIAPAGLLVEARESDCPAIQQSVVRRRNADGTLAPDALALGVPRLPAAPAFPAPRLMDTPLRGALIEMLTVVCRLPELADLNMDPVAVAKAFLACADLDEDGNLGFDLARLTPDQVRCIQALPLAAWARIDQTAEDAGWPVMWLDVHEDFELKPLAQALQGLSSLAKITVWAPKRTSFIDLEQLRRRGSPREAAQVCPLREMVIRPRSGKHFIVSIPKLDPEVTVSLAKNALEDSACLAKSAVWVVDDAGRTNSRRPFLQPKPLTSRDQTKV